MKCDVCSKEKERLHKFYWGFFKAEYDETKWCLACDDCQKDFQNASSVYIFDRTPLIEMYNKIDNNLKESDQDVINKSKTKVFKKSRILQR